MKTYHIEDVLDAPMDSGWVPAEVAQRLYDTLERVLNSGDWFGSALEFNSYEDLLGDQLEQLIRDTLAAADGEESAQ